MNEIRTTDSRTHGASATANWCQASKTIEDPVWDSTAELGCDREHDRGLHYDKENDVWWYSDVWEPDVPLALLETGQA